MVFLGGKGGGVVFLHPLSTTDLGLLVNCPMPAAPPGRGKGWQVPQLRQGLTLTTAFIKTSLPAITPSGHSAPGWKVSVPRVPGVSSACPHQHSGTGTRPPITAIIARHAHGVGWAAGPRMP